MRKKPDTKLNRRDFVTGTIGAAVGYGAFGLLPTLMPGAPLPASARNGGNPFDLSPRGPASSRAKTGWALTSPQGNLKSSYDTVVIGSGYGGAVLAARLAGQGGSLAVLERGKQWLPGDFPTNEAQLLVSSRSPLNLSGLVDWHATLSSHVDVVGASGVGGTSLINAAIATRPQDIVFAQPEWPQAIRDAFEDGSLTQYFDRAEQVLKPGFARQDDSMSKVRVHQATLKELNVPFGMLSLNINRLAGKDRLNAHGVAQSPCTMCGDCCSGCNVGAKNTLQVNYLPMAKARGAEIFAGIEVEWIEKLGIGYRIHYILHRGDIRDALPHRAALEAKRVVVAAGSLGSSEILMRSRAEGGLSISDALGSRVSANGDVLGFSYNGSRRTNAVGYGTTVHGLREGSPVGEAIMAFGDYRARNESSRHLQDRFLLLDGAIPTSLSNMVAKSLAAWAKVNPSLFDDQQKRRINADLSDPLSVPLDGALNHSMLLLACGHDSSGGRYVYRHGSRPDVIWPGIREERFYKAINAEMARHARKHGGVYLENPRSTLFGGSRLMATHPLGGCPMGESPDHGVVDHAGRVFKPGGGIHEGLYVTDASIIPRSLAATPLMTISALAERIADLILKA